MLSMGCGQNFLEGCVVHVMCTLQGPGVWEMYTWVCSGWDGCPFISTEAPVCGKTLWGGGWKEGRRKPQKSNSAWVVAQKQNSMLVDDSSIPTFKSKKDRRKDMIFKRGHSLLSSFQCVCGAGLVVCLLGLPAVILDQCSRAKRRVGISGQCGPWPLRYKKEVWLRSQVSDMG